MFGVIYYFVLIQKKVEAIEENDERWEKFKHLSERRGVEDIDMLVPRNFGICDNKIKLIDYGRKETITTLTKLYFY